MAVQTMDISVVDREPLILSAGILALAVCLWIGTSLALASGQSLLPPSLADTVSRSFGKVNLLFAVFTGEKTEGACPDMVGDADTLYN